MDGELIVIAVLLGVVVLIGVVQAARLGHAQRKATFKIARMDEKKPQQQLDALQHIVEEQREELKELRRIADSMENQTDSQKEQGD